MAKKRYVYKAVPIQEIYLSDYLEDISENGGTLDESLKDYQHIDDSMDTLALVTRMQDDRLLKVLILMMLGYKPREMTKMLDFHKVGEVYNAIQRIRAQFKSAIGDNDDDVSNSAYE
jgi:hypothetical protein